MSSNNTLESKSLQTFAEPQISRWIFFTGLLLTGIIAAIALLRSTPYGLGLVNDSVSYVNGAQNLMAGNGYTRTSGGGELKPITHFPPLFSISLAVFSAGELDIIPGARAFITVLYGLDVILLGLLVYQISRSMFFSLLAALILAFSDTFLKLYIFLMSEPLYLTWVLLAFVLLGLYYQGRKVKWLLLCGLTLGLSFLTRFAGVSLWGTIAVALIIFDSHWKKPYRFPFRPFLTLLVSFLLPVIIWTAVNYFISPRADDGLIGNRQLSWHPITVGDLYYTSKKLLTWAAPDVIIKSLPVLGRLMSLLSIMGLVILGIWLLIGLRRVWKDRRSAEPENNHTELALSLGLHIPTYIAFLFVSISLLDASIPLDDRMFSPVLLAGIGLSAAGLAWLWKQKNHLLPGKFAASSAVAFRLFVSLLCIFFVLTGIQDSRAAVEDLSREGQGFAHRGMSQSPAIPAIRTLPNEMVIYSNRPTATLILANRPAYILLGRIDPVTLEERPNYQAELNEMRAAIIDGKAALVIFGMINSSPEDIEEFQYVSRDLPVYENFGDVVIFAQRP